MASGSSSESGRSGSSRRPALRIPPSMTKCATWMPCGDNSRAMLCARPRSANLPIANGADCAIALDAGGGAGEQDRAVPVRQHPPRRLLRHQEAAERADRDAPARTSAGTSSANGAARPGAGVVDHDVGHADVAFDLREQRARPSSGSVASQAKARAPVSRRQRAELVDVARGQRDPHARRANSRAGSEALRPWPAPTIKRGAMEGRHHASLHAVDQSFFRAPSTTRAVAKYS